MDSIRVLSPEPADLTHLGLAEFPLAATVQKALRSSPRKSWAATGLDRTYYLDRIEFIIRAARGWQDDRGAIIDPVEKTEAGQTSPRYAAAGSILLAFGRARDLEESIFRAMDWSCRLLATGKASSPDFWMRELATAMLCLRPLAPQDRMATWEQDLKTVDPERMYSCVSPDGSKLETLHNWTVYGAAGEVLREKAGLVPPGHGPLRGYAFFDKYMPAQLGHFTVNGMYRDPHDPITYDVTTRLQIATALAFGYAGALRRDLQELLRRGALTQLLFLSPEGHVPFGGRSSQYHFQEAIIAALCELEARRYKDSSPELVGAFKRQAHLSARSTARWMEMNPFRHIKNGFDPRLSHGFDTYGPYSVYTVTFATFLGLAALFADDTIAESPCPAEIGGFALHLTPAFHKIFATAGDSQVEIDTQANLHYDATGLGRFCRTGVPLELGLSMPITATPAYRLPPAVVARQNMAIGPEWCLNGQWHRLADRSESLIADVEVRREMPDNVFFIVTYREPGSQTLVRETYDLKEGLLRYRVEVTVGKAPVDAIRLIVPLLTSDGDVTSSIRQEPGSVSVDYRQARMVVTMDPALTVVLSDTTAANRNGLYRSLTLEYTGHDMAAAFRLDRPPISPSTPASAP